MRLFDSHAHIDDQSFDTDRDQMLARARASGVTAVMIAGITEKTCVGAVALAESRPGLFASVGVHPHDAKSCSEAALSSLIQLAKSPVVRAWGETGLDFDRMYSPRAVQEKWFVRQLETAAKLKLPLIIHERATQGRLLEILSSFPLGAEKGVVHCFSGTESELLAYLDLGFYIGVTGICTQKERGAALRQLLGRIPRDRILIETDAPFLTPVPERNRHRRNEPAFVASVFNKVVQVRAEEDPSLFADALWKNTCRLYDITEKDFSPAG